MFIIPLTTSPNQKFTSTIPVDGKKIKFNFFLRFNTEAEYWVLDIFNSKNDSLIVSVNLVCGANLLEQYSYLNIGSAYIAKIDSTLDSDRPNEFNLGTNFQLIWSDTV